MIASIAIHINKGPDLLLQTAEILYKNGRLEPKPAYLDTKSNVVASSMNEKTMSKNGETCKIIVIILIEKVSDFGLAI